jgi:hypothetical protein
MQVEIVAAAGLFTLFVAALCLSRPAKENDLDVNVPAPYSSLYPLDGDVPLETAANVALHRVEDDVANARVVLKSVGEGEFEYWADKAVSYPDLEALARKWALVFGKVEVYKERKRVVTVRAAAPVDPVFATLKTYAPPKVVTEEQANVYRWRGKLRDLDEVVVAVAPKAVSYSDYKKNV